MKAHLFRLKGSIEAPSVESLSLDSYPQAGHTFVVLNFPVIERYVVEQLEEREDWFLHDWFEPVALVVRRETVLQTAASMTNVVSFNPDANFLSRLAKIEKLARATVDTKLTLEISHADFTALCDGSGLSCQACDIDVFAYHGIPMRVGEEDAEWNASTAFHGFSNDAHVLYVTWPGEVPFVMNNDMLETAKAFYACYLSRETAVAKALAIAVSLQVEETAELMIAIRDLFGLIGDGLMPVYDGAQELTRMTLSSFAGRVGADRPDRERINVPEGTRLVREIEAGHFINALLGMKPVPH
jgi:hypothetical protein